MFGAIMRLEELPDFAKPYKTKGYDVRKVRNSYQRFKITSKRVPGKKNPVLVQEYLGTIDPVKGFIPKKTTEAQEPAGFVEYGLSAFILKHFESELLRTMDCTIEQLCRGILYYIYGYAYGRFAELSYLRRSLQPVTAEVSDIELRLIMEIAQKIASLMEALIPDKEDRDYFIIRLRELRVNSDAKSPQVQYPLDLLDLCRKYKIVLE